MFVVRDKEKMSRPMNLSVPIDYKACLMKTYLKF